MSEEIVQEQVEAVQEAPQLSEREQIEQEAIERYRESQKTSDERAEGVPEGYNDDGTVQEELIGGKFKSQEDLLKAYQELETKLGQPKEAPAEKKNGEPPNQSETQQETKNFEKFAVEYRDNGGLSEESYKELEGQGFSKQDVDMYIAGQQAYVTQFTSDVYGVVGGQEQYTEVVTWAADNIEPHVIQEYNDALARFDSAKVKQNLEYMAFKMQQNKPQQTRRLEGESGGTGMQPYASKLEWQQAQSNRLYGKDAKYTNMVDQRYLASRRKGLI